MKKYFILIPIYNDRESLTKLIDNINQVLKGLYVEVSILVVNDASSQQIVDNYPNTENIHSIEIINMKQNRGHARCIATGLKYIYEKKEFDYVIPMDGDGEDRPEEIKNFFELSEKAEENSIKFLISSGLSSPSPSIGITKSNSFFSSIYFNPEAIHLVCPLFCFILMISSEWIFSRFG